MAKRKTNTASAVQVINQSIEVRNIDRSLKTLKSWKTALQSAENIANPTRKLLYDLYEDITLDEHLTSVMDQRRLALTNTSLSFQIDGEPVDDIEKLIKLECFEDLLTYILDVRFYGHSLIQCQFHDEKVELVHRAHVKPAQGIVVASPSDAYGIDYTIAPYDTTCVAVGKPKDLGLLLKAAPLVLLKRGDISDWATYNEIFGQPLRVGYYDPNVPGNKEQLSQGLANMGANGYAVLPDGSKIDFNSAYQTASADTYERFASRMDQSLSKLFVGQTMTTENGSSKSQGEVHERVADKLSLADRRMVLGYLNGQVRKVLIAQGYPADKGEFKWIEEEARLSKKDRLTMDLEIHTKVGKLKKKYIADEYNVEFVDDSDDELTEPEQQEQQPDQEQPGQEPKPKEKPAPPKPAKKQEQAAPTTDPSPFTIRGLLKLFKEKDIELLDALKGFFSKAPIH